MCACVLAQTFIALHQPYMVLSLENEVRTTDGSHKAHESLCPEAQMQVACLQETHESLCPEAQMQAV
jgi:hypothetical protein